MTSDRYPKVLAFSNNCFSETNNNGRTLGNFFSGWPRERLAQFYIKPEKPRVDLCANYLNITDGQALKMMLGKKVVLKDPTGSDYAAGGSSKSEGGGRKKTAFNMYLRNFIWKTGRWKKEEFKKFVDGFDPDVVILQAGDSPFMYKIASDTAKSKNVPLIIYNSEDHVLRKKNYFIDSPKAYFSYKLFRRTLTSAFKKAFDMADLVIYNSEKLQKTYTSIYGKHKSCYIYMSSSIKPKIKEEPDDPLTVSYFGNFYPDRAGAIVELANAFKAADGRIKVNVYGKPKEEDLAVLQSSDAIDLHGFISYDELKCVIEKSDVLIHAESFSEHFSNFNSHYFSTKIADCLASGKPLVIYAPENIAFAQYVRKNDAGIVISSEKDLYDTVSKIVKSPEFRNGAVKNALELADKNHDINKNREKFQSVIMDAVSRKK